MWVVVVSRGVNVTVIIDEQGQPWWIAKEVCDVLDINNSRQAVSRLDEDEKSYLTRSKVGLKPGRDLIIVNESGLYNLIFKSKKLIARVFKRWVTHEVLPEIRQTRWYEL